MDFLENVLVQLHEIKQLRVRECDFQGYQIPTNSRRSQIETNRQQPGNLYQNTQYTLIPNQPLVMSSKPLPNTPKMPTEESEHYYNVID